MREVRKKIPYKVVYLYSKGQEELVKEYVIMPSGTIVVLTESEPGFPESLWFDSKGRHPKSYLIFK